MWKCSHVRINANKHSRHQDEPIGPRRNYSTNMSRRLIVVAETHCKIRVQQFKSNVMNCRQKTIKNEITVQIAISY